MSDTGSTLPRRQLGRYLIDWRTRAGMSQQRAAELLEIGSSSLQRLERGQNDRIRVRDIQAACDLYGVPSELAEGLIGLARQASVKSWWHVYGDLIPKDFDVYMSLESAATQLTAYQPELVPGLFQTADYVRAIDQLARPAADETERERCIQLKLHRQNILTRKVRPTLISVVIGEAALRRVAGGPRVMAGQLRHLADMSTRPNVTLQVLPFSAGFPDGLASNPFVLLDFGIASDGKPVEPPVVFLEGGTVGDMYLEEPDDVQRYHRGYTAIVHAAQSPAASRDLLRQIAREYAL
ncbi:helix-turn-helix domain-containing protein [Nocardia colli]|uniref:helix-turn-helix domain-containing protein n=1 Tax=Nocardia colli TaxID=2545717 RepID=UPI0035E22CF9